MTIKSKASGARFSNYFRKSRVALSYVEQNVFTLPNFFAHFFTPERLKDELIFVLQVPNMTTFCQLKVPFKGVVKYLLSKVSRCLI